MLLSGVKEMKAVWDTFVIFISAFWLQPAYIECSLTVTLKFWGFFNAGNLVGTCAF